MTLTNFGRLRSLLAASLVTAGAMACAHATAVPDPSTLPSCLPGPRDGACLLPLKDGTFEQEMRYWQRGGSPYVSRDESGNAFATMFTGTAIRQAVYAHVGHATQDLAYALRFRVRADHGTARVGARLWMSDAQGEHRIPLSATTQEVGSDEWSTLELMAKGEAFPAPAHVFVEISSEGGELNTLRIDDVTLTQSTDVDVIGR